jgi:hypothetical protein
MSWMLPGGRRTEVPVGDVDAFVNAVIHQRVSGLVLEAFDEGAVAGGPTTPGHASSRRTSLRCGVRSPPRQPASACRTCSGRPASATRC